LLTNGKNIMGSVNCVFEVALAVVVVSPVAVGDFSDTDEDSYSVDVLRLPRIFTMYVGHLLLRIRRHVLFQSSICCWRQ
jgi:hypothetical protein